MERDYGLGWAQWEYDRQEGPNRLLDEEHMKEEEAQDVEKRRRFYPPHRRGGNSIQRRK